MKKFKVLVKILAASLAASIALCCTSCSDTSWAVKAGDDSVSAGVYLGFLIDAYYSASYSVSDTSKDVFEQKIDGVDAATYIKNTAKETAKQYITVNRLFDEYKLSFTDDELKVFDATVNNYWNTASALYEDNGCGKESFKKIMLMEEKYNKIFEYYYGEKGVEPLPEKDRQEYFAKNYAKIKYIDVRYSTHYTGVSSESTATDAQKTELKELADKYVERLKNGEDIDKLIDEEANFGKTEEQKKEEAEKEEEEHDHDHEHEEAEEEAKYTFLTKDTSDEPDAFNEVVFKANVNTPAKTKNSTYGYYVFVRYELDSDGEDYTDHAESVLSEMKGEAFKTIVEKQTKKIKFTENSAAIKRFKPQNIVFNF